MPSGTTARRPVIAIFESLKHPMWPVAYLKCVNNQFAKIKLLRLQYRSERRVQKEYTQCTGSPKEKKPEKTDFLLIN
jgi:hypothetical protein